MHLIYIKFDAWTIPVWIIPVRNVQARSGQRSRTQTSAKSRPACGNPAKTATHARGLLSNRKNNNMANEQVLVTGGSGFIGAHCILQLLNAGYRVRTTIRSPQREADVRAMLQQGGLAETDGGGSPSLSPILKRTLAGRRPSTAATTFSMLRRRSLPAFRNTRTS
jgi:hypothetical protein